MDDVMMWRGVPLEDMNKPQLIAALKHMARRERNAAELREKERGLVSRRWGNETDPNRWNMDYLR